MFSATSRRLHDERKRMLGPSYSRSTIYTSRVQLLIQRHVGTLYHFLETITNASKSNSTGHLLVRNIFRALTDDIFTSFAFSEPVGTEFLSQLRVGANTLSDLGMEDLKLWCEDTRESFFMFEREPELRWITWLLLPFPGETKHVRFEAFLSRIINRYEATIASLEKRFSDSEKGVYWRLLTERGALTGQTLNWKQRAAEIMDHLG